MNLGVVNKQPMMPSSSGTSWKSGAVAGDGGVPDQFPAGLRVLVVDDDPTCLMILEKMLRNCNYEVTKCNRAEVALSNLRENKKGFDVVISDVHMPDMDGFKLLEHIGLEMDLPVIMMSADDSKNVVMKGVTHGACDYLIKPVRIEALRNIWQHVVRKRKHEWKDSFEPSSATSAGDEQKLPQSEEPDYSSSANEGHNWKNTKRRKDEDDEGDERDDSSSLKKPRVVWSVELHQQFVAAVNQLGIDKAVPKKILELMNVPGLTRENVASHLQKYRLYLRRLSGSHQHPGGGFMGGPDSGYGSISSLNGLDIQALAASGQLGQLPPQSLATLQAAALGRSNKSTITSAPVIDQRNIFSFENPKMRFGESQSQLLGNPIGQSQSQSKPINLLPGIPTNMEPKQFVNLHSFGSMNTIQMGGQSQSQGMLNVNPHQVLRPPVLSSEMLTCGGIADVAMTRGGGIADLATNVYSNNNNNPVVAVSQPSSLVDFSMHNHKNNDSVVTSYPLGGSLGISNLSAGPTPKLPNKSSYSVFNDLNPDNVREWIDLQEIGMFGSSQGVIQGQNRNLAVDKPIFSPGVESGSHRNGSNVGQQRNVYVGENSMRVKGETFNDGGSSHNNNDNINNSSNNNAVYSEQYGDDLLAAILKQQQGVGQVENEFGFDGYAMDNLPV